MQLLLNLFFVVVLIQVVYFVFIIGRLKSKSIKKTTTHLAPVSVIIAARNEADNLKDFLPKVLEQNYPSFEVIVVNDGSTDSTLEVLKDYAQKFSHLRILSQAKAKHRGNKKKAITKAIELANYNQLLFTDADCYPSSPRWLLEMTSHFSDKTDIILGYGAYQKINGSLLNKLIRFETLVTAMLYFSHAIKGMPYMGVGRNLAYKREVFLANSGFKNHEHVRSGDDDLFVNEVSTNNNTDICISPDGFTISKPKLNLKSWLLQKRRHITTSYNYKPIHKISLGIFYVSQLLFYSFAFVLCISGFKLQTLLLLVILRYIIQIVVYFDYAKKLKEPNLILYLPLLEFCLIVLQLYIFMHNIVKKPNNWS